jgi:cytosine deaminase
MTMSPFDPSRWPERLPPRYWLANAAVPAALLDEPAAQGRVSLLVEGGRIAAVEPHAPGGAATFDLDGATVFSAFVDAHTHLDKGDLLAAGMAPERDLFAAVTAVRADYGHWTEAELRARIGFALRSAFAHGTRAINSYCDWSQADGPLAWRVLVDLRREWAGRIELVLTSLAAIDEFADADRAETIARAVAAAGGVLGLFVYPGAPVDLLPRVFDLAERHDLRLDFHIDEHLDPPVANLPLVLRLARERGLGSRTVCGHVCAIGVLAPGERDRILDHVAEARVSLVSLPFTNLYLQDSGVQHERPPHRRMPLRRGLLPVHEARARGIALAFASDNHRDPFFPGGDLDPLQALALAACAAHLDDPVEHWADTITSGAARILGLSWDGVLRPGAPADLVIHPGRCSAEIVSRPAVGRHVIRAGQRLAAADATLPDFRELDGLRGRAR